jgi:hypothetical protein
MSFGDDAKVRERCLFRGNTSNKTLEWTATTSSLLIIDTINLPLRGSVRRIGSQGKNPWHKISGLKIDRSAIFSVHIDGRV